MDKNFSQFCLDLPRIKLFINQERCLQNHDYVFNFLKTHFSEDIIYYLTQTFLADFYINECKSCLNDEFILDNGDYIISIDTDDKILQIQKNFRKVYLDLDSDYLMDLITLFIFVDLTTFKIIYSWIYDTEKFVILTI